MLIEIKNSRLVLTYFLDKRVLKNEFLIESNSKRLIARRKLTVIGFCERFKKKGSQRLIIEKESSVAEAAMFNDHSLQKVPFIYGNTGCGVFKRGLQN